MEMQRRSDCGLDTCNVTNTKSHPPTHLNNTRKGITMRDDFHPKLDHKKHTQGSRRTLKDCKVKTPPPPLAAQRLNALKSVNCVANRTSHLCFKENDLCTAPPRLHQTFLFTLNYEPATENFTLNDFTFLLCRKLLLLPFFC